MKKLLIKAKIICYANSEYTSRIQTYLPKNLNQKTYFCSSLQALFTYYQAHSDYIDCIIYHAQKDIDHTQIIKQLNHINFYPDIILILDQKKSYNIKEMLKSGVCQVLETPFYNSEFNLAIQRSLSKHNITEKIHTLLLHSNDVSDFIHYQEYYHHHCSIPKSQFLTNYHNKLPSLPFHELIPFLKNHCILKDNDRTASILIIEDDKPLNEKLSLWLETKHYVCTSAYHYDQAIERLTSNSFDIIFIDIGLSGKSGEDLVQFIQFYHPDSISIVITAFNDSELMLKCLNSGADDFITKPFSPTEIIKKITYYQGIRQAKKLPTQTLRNCIDLMFYLQSST